MSETNIKERIKQSADSLLMQYGIRSVSMDDIAAGLGMSKKTIYLYFKDKDELVEAVVEDKLSKNQCSCTHDRQNAVNAIHEIFLAMDMIAEMFREMNPSLLFDLQKYHPETFTRFLKHKNDFLFNIMKQNLERGIAEELYRPDINVNVMARFRIESMFIPFNPEFVQSTKSSLLEIEQQVITHYLFGLVTLKGYKMILKFQEQRKKIENI